MLKRQSVWMIGALCATVVALVLLASGLGRVTLGPGRPFAFPQLGALPSGSGAASGPDEQWRQMIAVIIWAFLALFVLALVFSRATRRRALQYLIAIVVWYVFLSQLLRTFHAPGESTGGAPPQPTQAPDPISAPPAMPDFIVNPPGWAVLGLNLLLALVVAGLIGLLWWRLRPRPKPLERLADAAEEALASLSTGAALKDTVMRCYAEMCQVIAEQRGIARGEAMTPREFEQYLAAAGVRDEHIHQLTRLFERVRYSPAAPSQREELEAAACLRAIANAYGTSS